MLLQELISELQDQESFGKRGEGWAFAELAAILLLLIPPFTLTVGFCFSVHHWLCCGGCVASGCAVTPWVWEDACQCAGSSAM